jgi:hypothetical protein
MSVGEGETAMSVSETSLRDVRCASQCKRDSDSTSEPWVAAMSVGEGETAMSVSETSLRDVRCAYENGES